MKTIYAFFVSIITLVLILISFNQTTSAQTEVIVTPQDATVNVNASATFNVQVLFNSVDRTSSGEYSFEWYKDGVLLDGETLSTLQFTTSDVADSGSFYCIALQVFDMTPTTSNTVKLHVTDNGCPSGFATAQADKASYCVNKDTIRLTAGGGVSYLWDNNATSLIRQIVPTATGNFSYTVSVTDGAGCTELKNVSVLVTSCTANPPTVFIQGVSPICSGQGITLEALPSGGTAPYTYTWLPSAGLNNITVASPYASPVATTKYTVKVTDNVGATATATVNVVVTPLPVFTAGADRWSCGFDGVTIGVLQDSVGSSYEWSSGELTSFITVYPTSTTTYTLTVTSMSGCSSSDNIVVNTSASFLEPMMTDSISGNTLVIKNEFINDTEQKIMWDFGDGYYSTLKLATHTYDKSGIYTVKQTLTDIATGCKVQNSMDVTIGTGGCKADFNYSIDGATKTVTFSNNSSSTLTDYMWYFGNSYSSTSANPIYTYTYAGYYNVELYAFDKATGCMDKVAYMLEVGDVSKDCEADFYYDIDLTTHAVSFFNTSFGKGLSDYGWDFGDNTFSSTQHPDHTYADGDYYNVCLTAMTPVCKNITCKEIKAGNEKTFCKADFDFMVDASSLKLTVTDQSYGAADTWLWDFAGAGKATTEKASFTFATKGYYQVSLKIENSKNGCVSFVNKLVNVGEQEGVLKCAFGYLTDSSMNIKGVLPVEFKGASYGDAATVEWEFGDGTSSSSSMAPIHQYPSEGTYKVCMKIEDPITGLADSNCTDVTVTSTGIADASETAMLSIHPNPAKEVITLNLGTVLQEKDMTIPLTIFNVLGEQVLSDRIQVGKNGTYKLEVKSLAPGVYMLKTGNHVAKFIKQ